MPSEGHVIWKMAGIIRVIDLQTCRLHCGKAIRRHLCPNDHEHFDQGHCPTNFQKRVPICICIPNKKVLRGLGVDLQRSNATGRTDNPDSICPFGGNQNLTFFLRFGGKSNHTQGNP